MLGSIAQPTAMRTYRSHRAGDAEGPYPLIDIPNFRSVTDMQSTP